MEKIKILQFSVANGNGGRSLYTLNNWKHIDKNSFLFDFVTFNNNYELEGMLNDQGCTVHHFSCRRNEDEESFIAQWISILKNGYDVIHLNTSYWDSMILEEIAMKMGIKKVIIHSHNSGIGTASTSEERNRLTDIHYKVREQLNMSKATDFWACSQEASEWLFGDKIPKNRIKIMKNAIDTSRFSYDQKNRDEVRRKLGFKETDYIIGNIGRFALQKNQFFLLDVYADSIKHNPKIKLMFRGDGLLKEELKAYSESLGISDKVFFIPRLKEVQEVYNAMDLLAMPSLFEGLSVCFLEAQASGLHAICSDNLTKEADCTGTIKYLPLDKKIWTDAIVKESYIVRHRNSQIEELKANGYDIDDQIKILEKEYKDFK